MLQIEREVQKNNVKRMFIIGIVVLIFSIVGFAAAAKMMADSKVEPIDMNSSSFKFEDLEVGDRVQGELSTGIGYFYYYKEDGSETSRIYAFASLREDEDWIYVDKTIGVQTTDFSKADRVCDSFADWWDDENATMDDLNGGLEIDGVVKKLTNDEKAAFIENLEDLEYDDDEIEEMMIPYKIVRYSDDSAIALVVAIGAFIASVILISAGAVSSAKLKKSSGEEELE